MTNATGMPGECAATFILKARRDKLGQIDPSSSGSITIPGCVISHSGWSEAKGLWDESEEGLAALNVPCLYHHAVKTQDGREGTHAMLAPEVEVTIPEGYAMAGSWMVESPVACSADGFLGDVLRLRRK